MCGGCDAGGRRAAAGKAVATLSRMTSPPPLPDGVSIGPATAGDVAELLALWAGAAENDARPADTGQAVLALLARDPDACLVRTRHRQLGFHAAPVVCRALMIPPRRS